MPVNKPERSQDSITNQPDIGGDQPVSLADKVVATAVLPAPSTHSHVSVATRVGAASTAIGTEVLFGVPFDGYKNRLMANPAPQEMGLTTRLRHYAIGQDYKNLNFSQSLSRMYRGGVGYSSYKIFNRGGKLTVQPFLMETMMQMDAYKMAETHYGKQVKVLAAATSGAALGLAEVAINPIDRMRVLCQVGRTNVQGMHEEIKIGQAFKTMRGEGWEKQFSGARATAWRNMLGSYFLFGGKYFTYHLMKVEDHNKPTLVQSTVSSAVASTAMIASSHLPDFVKVRQQLNPEMAKLSIPKTLLHIAKTEGVRSLTGGLAPKFTAAFFKTTAALTVNDMALRGLNSSDGSSSAAKEGSVRKRV